MHLKFVGWRNMVIAMPKDENNNTIEGQAPCEACSALADAHSGRLQ